MIVVTIPAYNEERNIGRVIEWIKTAMTGYRYRILVVDDGSRDGTAEAARRHGARVVRHPYHYGLAETFRTEMENCLRLKADIIVHIDADGQYSPDEITSLLREIKNGYDLVLGSRFKGHIEYMPLMKRIGNIAFSTVVSHIAGVYISDCQTGFRAFTSRVAREIKIISSYTYTQEQIIRCVRQRFRVKEVPVTFYKRKGRSRLMKNPFDYAVKAGINILRLYRDFQPLKFFGFFGLLFFCTGFVIGIWLLYLYLTTGRVGHMPSTILSMMLMLMGIQIGLFGFFADMKK